MQDAVSKPEDCNIRVLSDIVLYMEEHWKYIWLITDIL